MNFSLQDIFHVWVAVFLFPSVLLFPGYVVGYMFDLLDFSRRRMFTRYIIAVVTSVACAPILIYLFSLYTSSYAIRLVLALFFILYIFIVVSEFKKSAGYEIFHGLIRQYEKTSFFIVTGWVLFSSLSLVDLQLGNRLYNNVISLDFATRVTLVDAITRTGVPPVNPSYFPGHPEYITSLYYFWYILCSLVDQFGGDLVDARTALIAGDIWCGLALMALVALYLKLRNRLTGDASWKTAIFGIGLLAISGLDVVPAFINMIVYRFSFGFMWPAGDLEHWNEQITAWVGSLFWAPHHVAATIACLTGFMIFQHSYQKHITKKIFGAIIAGLALASAVGLSTWVTLTFSLFFGVWALFLFAQNKEKIRLVLMILVGLVALSFASPFLLGVLEGGTGASGSPIVMEVRRFLPVVPYTAWLPNIAENIVYFLLLPINYLLELGFFLVVGLLWIQRYRKREMLENPFFVPEIILLCVVFVVCSFMRSAIFANDLGWRGWLFGQFILLVWAVDIQATFPYLPSRISAWIYGLSPQKPMAKNYLSIFLIIGLVTSIADVTLLRFWPVLVDAKVVGFPNGLSPDTQLGKRTFASRLAYEFIRDELPSDVVVQQNPLGGIDRPSGLYGTRQAAISANAPYNVSLDVLEKNTNQISKIFTLDKVSAWEKIDSLCHHYFIDVIIVNDVDPLWDSLPILYQYRHALYSNQYYAVLACGHFAEMIP